MKPAVTAALVATAPEESPIPELLRQAGCAEVRLLSGLPLLERTGTDTEIEFHLPADWRGVELFVLEEWIGGRSAFELLPLLRTSVEGKEAAVCFLAESPFADTTVLAAWCAGVEMFLNQPVVPDDFRRLVSRLLEQRAQEAIASG